MIKFFLNWNKKFCDFDGILGNQCVDIVKQYFKDVLRLPIFKGNAIDYWVCPPEGFIKIKKSWFNRPEPGDLIIWNLGQYGHIAICNWSRFFDVGVFEQNNPKGSPCHYKDYSYLGVLGWLRPILLPKIPLEIARIGAKLPPGEEFMRDVGVYSSGKITTLINDYNASFTGTLTQDLAYDFVDFVNPKEKFIFIFYQGGQDQVFYKTYYYPKRDCIITTCPGVESRLLAFEFAHSIQTYYNTHRAGRPYVEIIDNFSPPDELIKQKYDSVSEYYQP